MSAELVAASVGAIGKSEAARKRLGGGIRMGGSAARKARKMARKLPSTPKKPPYEGVSRIAIPHGKRSSKLDKRGAKVGARANAAYDAGKYKRSGKLAAKAGKLHAKATKASGKYQSKQAKKTPVLHLS